MIPNTVPDFLLTMATGLLLLGVISFAIALYLLVSKAVGKDTRTIAEQTAELAKKGIADDVSGLVGNASSLLNALDQLVKTSAGIGIFLMIISIILMGGAYLLITQIP